MQSQCFRNLLAHGKNRIQRSHRVLKDHRYVVAAGRAHLGVRELQQILSIEKYLARDNLSGWRYQSHDRQRRDRFTTAALTDQSQQLSRIEIKTDPIDRADQSFASLK